MQKGLQDCSPTVFMCPVRSAVSGKTIYNSTAGRGAVCRGSPQGRTFELRTVHSVIQAPSHLPVRAERIVNKPKLILVTRESVIRNDTPNNKVR